MMDALKWTRKHGRKYNLDTAQLGCWGESAGGQMCAVLASEAKLKVAVSMFGRMCFLCPHDKDLPQNGGFEDLFGFPVNRFIDLKAIQDSPNMTVADKRDIDFVRSAEPLELVTSKTSPMVLAIGSKDSHIPLVVNIWMATALKEAGVKHLFLKENGGDHLYANWKHETKILDKTLNFVLEEMKPPKISIDPSETDLKNDSINKVEKFVDSDSKATRSGAYKCLPFSLGRLLVLVIFLNVMRR